MATGNDMKFRISVDAGSASKELDELGDAVDRASKEADGLATSGRKAADSTDKLGGSANAAGGLLKNLGATIAAGFTFQALVDAAAQFESVKAGLLAVSGSAESANEQMDFVRQTANRTGADINEVGRAFLGLAAATKGTAVEGEPTRQVFESVANAMSKAGKSSAETQNALIALAQIASKGTVSMEELRGQLGEALPGALQAAANGLGVTTKDLIALVEQGQIAAEDLFPALADGLDKLYGGGAAGAQTLAQEITNIKNAFIELAADLGEAGGLDALKIGAEIAQAALVLMNDALVTTGKTIGTLAGAVATLDFSQLSAAFAEIEQESRDKLLKAAEHNATLAKYIGLAGNEALQTALKNQQAGNAAKVAGEQAAGAAAGFVSLGSAYSKVRTEIEKQIEATGKAGAAREAEAKLALDIANAYGTEAEKRAAAAEQARVSAEAARVEASLRTTLADLAKSELDAKRALLEQGGKISEQRQKDLDDLAKEAKTRQDVADKANAQAASAKLAADAASIAAQAAQDNSGRLRELADAYQVAAERVRFLTESKAAGLPVDAELTRAQQEAGKAALLYRDALADTTAIIRAQADAKRADLQLAEAGLRVQLDQYRSLEATARAIGDENLATYAKIEAKKIEIRLIETKVAIMKAEADGAIAVAQATRAELEASGQLTRVKEIELDTSIKVAQAKLQQAGATSEAVKIAQLEIEALQNGTAAKLDNAASSEQAGSAISNESGSRENNAGAIDKETDALRRRQSLLNQQKPNPQNPEQLGEGVRKDGNGYVNKSGMVSDAKGNAITAAVPTWMSLFNYAKSLGITEQQARDIADQGFDQQGNYKQNLQRSQMRGSLDSIDIYEAARRAAENLLREQTTQGGQQLGRSTTVNINLNGQKTRVNVASQEDANALESLLRQLAADGARA
jgi:tape measure domain-containing protein